MTQRTAHAPFAHQLGVILDGEHQLFVAQKELLVQAQDHRLKALLEAHSRETEQQIARLEQIGPLLGERVERHPADRATAFVHENQLALQMAAPGSAAADLAIAEAALRAEEWEIAAYAPVVSAAEHIDTREVRHLLHQNLQEEEQTAHLLKEQILRLSGAREDSDTLRSAPL